MGKAGPLRWRDGRGWIVLVGGGNLEETADIMRAAIEEMSDESPAVFVPTASESPDEGRDVVAQIERLGGPVGYVAPIMSRTDATDRKNVRRLTQAGLVYLGSGQAQRLVETLSGTPALDALEAAYEAGAVIVAAGQAACALGAWGLYAEDTEAIAGWGWLPDALVCPHFDVASPALRKAIKSHSDCLGLGIPEGTALALGPDAARPVLTWSASGAQVTVVLGSRFGAK